MEIVRNGWAPASTLQLLDRVEQVVTIALFSWLSWRVLASPNAFAPLLLISEGLVIIFVLLRRPSAAISMHKADWAIAFAATFFVLLVNPDGDGSPRFAIAGTMLFVMGTGWQLWAKLVLRRSFGVAPANRGIKVAGPYRAMRHPMYFGYFITQISILVLMFSVWNLVLYVVAWALQILRLRREEALLMQDPDYRAYALAVPYRVIPRVH